MRPKSHYLIALVQFLIIVTTANMARGVEINVINHSFEQVSRALAVGEQTNGAGPAGVTVATRFPFSFSPPDWSNPVEVPGWRTRLVDNGSDDILFAGVLNPPLIGADPFITGQDGQNLFAIQVEQAGQTLDHVLQPNTRYTLSFRAGIGLIDSDYGVGASLIAVDDQALLPLENWPGVTRLAITQGVILPSETAGAMLPFVLEYTTPEILPPELAGRYIGIHMYGSDGLPRVLYDDFRLDATVIPEPSCVILLIAGTAMLRCRRTRAH